MKRALGAVTSWDTFKKMTEGDHSGHEHFETPSGVHIAPHVHAAAQVRHPSLVQEHTGTQSSQPMGDGKGPGNSPVLPDSHPEKNGAKQGSGLKQSHESEKGHHAAHGSDGQHAHTQPDQPHTHGAQAVDG